MRTTCNRFHTIALAVVFTLVLGLPACSTKGAGARVTRENADKLQIGMSQAEVETILGPGRALNKQEIDQKAANCDRALEWERGTFQVIVGFSGGKVVYAKSGTKH